MVGKDKMIGDEVVSAVIGQKKTTCFKRGGAEHTDANEIT
jgi:hypothetical protein